MEITPLRPAVNQHRKFAFKDLNGLQIKLDYVVKASCSEQNFKKGQTSVFILGL